MANNFNNRTWTLDTAGATSLYTGPVFLGRMSWHPGAGGQTLIVQNALGHTMWKIISLAATTDTSPSIEDWPNPEHKMPWDGFYISQMDGGTLYVTVI